jgi:hypothetical protein
MPALGGLALLAASIIGAVLSLTALRDSYGDYRYQVRHDGNGRVEVADEETSRDAMRFLIMSLSVGFSLELVMDPRHDYTFQTIMAYHCWMFFVLVDLAKVVRERISRHTLMALLPSQDHV